MSLLELTALEPDDGFDWPLFGLEDDVRPAMAAAAARGRTMVLATLHRVIGGAPRGVGAQMVFVNGAATGFLSGGCVEADLARHAREVAADGRPRQLVYGEGGPWDIRLPCGSRIEVLLERVAPNDSALNRLLHFTAARQPASWFTDGNERVCLSFEESTALGQFKALAARSPHDRICTSQAAPFALVRRHRPSVRLVAIGADPIALAVAKLAAEMGMDTVLARPKGPEHCSLPGVLYRREEVEAVLADLKPDPWTAIAVLVHGAEQEQAALAAALRSDAGYIGALGSRRRIPDRNALLETAGFADRDMRRIRAPIGLPIGGKSPWEIAVSVIAEVVDALTPR